MSVMRELFVSNVCLIDVFSAIQRSHIRQLRKNLYITYCVHKPLSEQHRKCQQFNICINFVLALLILSYFSELYLKLKIALCITIQIRVLSWPTISQLRGTLLPRLQCPPTVQLRRTLYPRLEYPQPTMQLMWTLSHATFSLQLPS